MSEVKSIKKSIRVRNNELKEKYLDIWGASEVGVTELRNSVEGNLRFSYKINSSRGSYEVAVTVLFLPGENKVVLGKWYYKDSEQLFYKNAQDKPEGLVETEKALLENFVMDIQDLELL